MWERKKKIRKNERLVIRMSCGKNTSEKEKKIRKREVREKRDWWKDTFEKNNNSGVIRKGGFVKREEWVKRCKWKDKKKVWLE